MMVGAGRKLLLIAALLSGSGCANMREAWNSRAGYYTQNIPDLKDDDVAAFTKRQNNIWNCLVSMAQARAAKNDEEGAHECPSGDAVPNRVKSQAPAATVADAAVPAADDAAARALGLNSFNSVEKSKSTGAPTYSEVVAAGLNYVDVRCDRFMDALFWFNRIRETSSRQIQFVSAASSAALTILKASEELIGLAPLGITLLDQTVNNVGRGLLYDLPPHTVRTLVEKQQQAYLKGVAPEYTSRPDAMRTIQGYAAICLPASIEAEVSRAVEASEFKPIAWQEPGALAKDAAPADSGTREDKSAAGQQRGLPPPNNVPAVERDN
jgi:hypothetical protein